MFWCSYNDLEPLLEPEEIAPVQYEHGLRRFAKSDAAKVVDRLKTEVSRNSSRHRGSVLWNALPYALKQTKDENVFKNNLKSYNKLINDFKSTKGNIIISYKEDDCFY